MAMVMLRNPSWEGMYLNRISIIIRYATCVFPAWIDVNDPWGYATTVMSLRQLSVSDGGGVMNV